MTYLSLIVTHVVKKDPNGVQKNKDCMYFHYF